MEYDYIVIGAGSAGCVVAERLTEDASVTVLLLEAGGPDYRLDFRTQMPAALSYPLQGTRYNWAYETDPEPNLNNRRIQCGRGKGLGGSSLINGMCYIRGNALDFDGWAQAPGMQNWSYLHCLPYFRKAEKRDAGANDYHGDQGPLYVTTSKSTTTDPLLSAWIKAGHEAGYPITDDLNGYQQEGFGPMDRTVTSFGRRASTARSYLDLAKDRHNLRIETHANVDVIEFEQRIARAVRYFKGGATASTTVRAKREIIMCSGAIASPALLQRSGVGDKKLLESLGIEVVLDQPFVGENLQDHVEMYVQYACKEPVTLYPSLKAWRKPGIGAEWLFSGTGIGASNQFEAGAFVRSSQKQAWPNIQFHFLPLAICYNGTLPVMEHSFQMHVGSMRSESRGRIKIRSKHAHDAPSILFNYMSTPEDWEEMRSCLRVARDVARQPALKKFTGKELAPGAHLQSDKELDDFIRQHAETAFHPCGTCKMGEDDTAVVDSEGRVHGVKNLRVVDASIMPRIITGNLNATTIMMAEKISDLIRKKSSLSASTVSYFVAEQTR